jgi:hypothetical protein
MLGWQHRIFLAAVALPPTAEAPKPRPSRVMFSYASLRHMPSQVCARTRSSMHHWPSHAAAR